MRWSLVASVLGIAGGLGLGCSSSGTTSSGSLNRLHVVNQPLAVVSSASPSGLTTKAFTTASTSVKFTYLAAVDAPQTADGRPLQATSFAMRKKVAYVVYNMAGSEVYGALDIIDVANPAKPKLVASQVYSDAEFADVKVSGHKAYLVGQRQDDGTTGALRVVDVTKAAAPKVLSTTTLGSKYATSLSLRHGTALITTGSDGALLTVDVSKGDPAVTATVKLANALDVNRHGDDLWVLGGATATDVYGAKGGTLSSTRTVASSSVDAPGRFARRGSFLVTNAGHTGLSIVDLRKSESAEPVFHGALAGTGNGVVLASRYAIFAQGEAGCLVYDVHAPAVPTAVGSFAFPDERGSANNVARGLTGNGRYVFLSDGLGGFRVLSYAADGSDVHKGDGADDFDDQQCDDDDDADGRDNSDDDDENADD